MSQGSARSTDRSASSAREEQPAAVVIVSCEGAVVFLDTQTEFDDYLRGVAIVAKLAAAAVAVLLLWAAQ